MSDAVDIEKAKIRSKQFIEQLDTERACIERNIENLKAQLEQTIKLQREMQGHWDQFFRDIENGFHD